MSIRKKMFLVNFISLAMVAVLIGAINVLSITEGLPLLAFVIVIVLLLLLGWASFFGALRYKPSAEKVADDIVFAIIRAISR